jgi:hypothetical protein
MISVVMIVESSSVSLRRPVVAVPGVCVRELEQRRVPLFLAFVSRSGVRPPPG